MDIPVKPLSRAQISRQSIERLYIAMRHLFMRGKYKPLGMSGEAMIKALLALSPEIYGSINDPERVELDGLLYIFQRLPQGIEASRYIKLITREGFENSDFKAIIPSKRRRNCYQIDEEQMYIEMTRGLSDIFDVLTHLTFMYIESEKMRTNALDSKGRIVRNWKQLEDVVKKIKANKPYDKQVAYTYLSSILGRTFEETEQACIKFEAAKKVNTLFEIVYALGLRSIEEFKEKNDREIIFSSTLREQLGNHRYGEFWAQKVKKSIIDSNRIDRNIHIISANLHSVMNMLYAPKVLQIETGKKYKAFEAATLLSQSENRHLRQLVKDYALEHGMTEISDDSGTNITVQIFDLEVIDTEHLNAKPTKDVLVVMDYAFGKQAYETMDELLKPFETVDEKIPWKVQSVNIMGKAGILTGNKGDIMIPTAHIFEGSADNYPFQNEFKLSTELPSEIEVFTGPMITVLGTSLQNKDILRYFKRSSWGVIGLEMEGAHYQKAIQAASQIRNSVTKELVVRYAYYASDNPLESGATLASGSLGLDGVIPTYTITASILNGILQDRISETSE